MYPVWLYARRALEQSRVPLPYEIVSGVAAGVVAGVIGESGNAAMTRTIVLAVAVALGTALLLWALRFLWHLWLAPHYAEAESQSARDSAYANLQEKYEQVLRELGKQREKDKETTEQLSLAHFRALSIVKNGRVERLKAVKDYDVWFGEVEEFKGWLITPLQSHQLTHAERAQLWEAFRSLPPRDVLGLNAYHAEMWQTMNAVCSTLYELLIRYETKTRSIARPHAGRTNVGTSMPSPRIE